MSDTYWTKSMFTLFRNACLFFFLGHAYSSSHAIWKYYKASIKGSGSRITLVGLSANTLLIFWFDPLHPTFCRILTYLIFLTANINLSNENRPLLCHFRGFVTNVMFSQRSSVVPLRLDPTCATAFKLFFTGNKVLTVGSGLYLRNKIDPVFFNLIQGL